MKMYICFQKSIISRNVYKAFGYDLLNRCYVYFSPVFGEIEPAQIVEFMLEKKLNKARIQIQMHKVIWDPDKRGV